MKCLDTMKPLSMLSITPKNTATQLLLGILIIFSIFYKIYNYLQILFSTSDHETGGLTLGLQTDFAPDAYPDYAYYPEKLTLFNASCDTMVFKIMKIMKY